MAVLAGQVVGPCSIHFIVYPRVVNKTRRQNKPSNTRPDANLAGHLEQPVVGGQHADGRKVKTALENYQLTMSDDETGN